MQITPQLLGRDTKMASLELQARLDNLLATAQTEMADVDLFAPIQEREECPICMIPLPIEDNEIRFMTCCGKSICIGCDYKQQMSEIKNGVPKSEQKCAFCCQPDPENHIKALKKLMKKNNPNAFMAMAERYKSGDGVFQSDTRSLEMHIRAAELGHIVAFTIIGYFYDEGSAVEQDMSKASEYYEIAAKKGSVPAHQYLALFHESNGNIQNSINHRKVAASAGNQPSMNKLMKYYKQKLLSREDLTQTLRAFQTSNNAMKSKDRDDACTARYNGLF